MDVQAFNTKFDSRFLVSSIRFEEKEEFRHAFNVTGCNGILPQEEVDGFKTAVDELRRDFKQLATMLLTVMI